VVLTDYRFSISLCTYIIEMCCFFTSRYWTNLQSHCCCVISLLQQDRAIQVMHVM